MQSEYFETLHRQEAQRADWYLVDTALRERTGHISDNRKPLKTRFGRWLIRVGTQLAGDQLVTYTHSSNSRHSAN
ncbi:MAG: hypothetical protein GFH27_549297n274 [Chloroflexi bacterium AL-W]|nr:hypothetical protein [Chloroflexi bacterium AL-N1]NOK68873.1 hypothetical protein [Chloroflexi bacterium AL-N10]NOK76856.1 hypothetical protein [Chloroflexi bacterium AL-N5]NOK82756.1 hypothetical protein [Chloroflexi bacterium AL-W]NOK90713.1 hypothetical protein [Chloroflexi bacterium AL-N15]